MRLAIVTVALVFSGGLAFADGWNQPARDLAAATAGFYEQWLKVRVATIVSPEQLSSCKANERRIATMNESLFATDQSANQLPHQQSELTADTRVQIRSIYSNYARGVVFCLKQIDKRAPLPLLRPVSADHFD